MKIHPQNAVQTYRLVDERREALVRGPLSLLMPGTRGGHLLLALPDGPPECAPGAPALGVAVSRGPADSWQLLAAAGAGRAPLPRRVFCFAFLAGDRSLVFYEHDDEDGGVPTV